MERRGRPLRQGRCSRSACSTGALADVQIVDMRREYAELGAGRDAEPAAAGGDRGSARQRRADAGAPEPARVCDGHFLPPVRRVARVPALQRVADVPPRAAARAVPLLQLRARRCRRSAAPAAASTSSNPASAPSGSRRTSRRGFPERAWCASIATPSAAGARLPPCCRPWRAATSTSSSARR